MRSFIPFLCLLFLLPISVFSQTRVLTGTVSNNSGAPIPFATVSVRGTDNTVAANENGAYSINVSGNNVTIVISSAGFADRTINVKAATSYNVTLDEAGPMTEVVVTALGIKREKKALGYSSQEVSGEDLAVSKQTNVVNALRGKVAGVQINSGGGAPGQGSRIIIRGIKSLDGKRYNNRTIRMNEADGGFKRPNDETGTREVGHRINKPARKRTFTN